MPEPMMMPTTIAVACFAFRTRGSSADWASASDIKLGDYQRAGMPALDVVPFVVPDKGALWSSATQQINVFMLVGHGVGIVEMAQHGDAAVDLEQIFRGVAGDGDRKFRCAAVRSPDPVVVVAADRRRKAGFFTAGQEVDC